MITSRLSRRGRTTVPRSVREALRLTEGDTLAYDVGDGVVVVWRLPRPVGAEPFACFGEWADEADRVTYADL